MLAIPIEHANPPHPKNAKIKTTSLSNQQKTILEIADGVTEIDVIIKNENIYKVSGTVTETGPNTWILDPGSVTVLKSPTSW